MPPPSPLPKPSASFTAKKAHILTQLLRPDDEYTDLSPKGSVDEGVRVLIGEINARDGLVTTSSCAGRISVFLEGRKKGTTLPAERPREEQPREYSQTVDVARIVREARAREARLAGVGGKGGGGKWIFVSHDPVEVPSSDSDNLVKAICFAKSEAGDAAFRAGGMEGREYLEQYRLIHFKFEPMILHILTASPAHAQLIIHSGLAAGFRETGAVSLLPAGGESEAMPVVAVRSMGLGFESIIGAENGAGRRDLFVSSANVLMLIRLANERFDENRKRIERFQSEVRRAMSEDEVGRDLGAGSLKDEWEDAETRRERKRAEGLKRSAEVREQRERERMQHVDDQDAGDGLLGSADAHS